MIQAVKSVLFENEGDSKIKKHKEPLFKPNNILITKGRQEVYGVRPVLIIKDLDYNEEAEEWKYITELSVDTNQFHTYGSSTDVYKWAMFNEIPTGLIRETSLRPPTDIHIVDRYFKLAKIQNQSEAVNQYKSRTIPLITYRDDNYEKNALYNQTPTAMVQRTLRHLGTLIRN